MNVLSSMPPPLLFKAPEFGSPPSVFIVHCVVWTAAAKLPLLWARRAGDPISVRARRARQENATLRIFEPYFVIMFMIAFFLWPPQIKMERLVVFLLLRPPKRASRRMPQSGPGLSCFRVVRRVGVDWTGLADRKIRPVLTDAA